MGITHEEHNYIGIKRLRFMKACKMKGTNPGLVTTYNTPTSQYIHVYFLAKVGINIILEWSCAN